jgi:hypothetical protein
MTEPLVDAVTGEAGFVLKTAARADASEPAVLL